MKRQMLGLSSVSNARQLGGYPAAGGRRVKDGVLLRSGTLYGAQPGDIDILTRSYGLKTVIDLRTEREAAQKPDPEIAGVRYFGIPLLDEEQDAGSHAAIVDIYRSCGDNPGRAYVEMVRAGALSDTVYTAFFDSEASLAALRRMFDVLLECGDGAVLLHCTGGKDRAGLACVLLLSVLGAEKETILADFALTNAVLRQKTDAILSAVRAYTDDPAELAQAEALAGISVPHMNMVFERAETECGSMLAFIQKKTGLTDAQVEALRDKYLE